MEAVRKLSVPATPEEPLGLGLEVKDRALLLLAMVVLDINRPMQDALNRALKLESAEHGNEPWALASDIHSCIGKKDTQGHPPDMVLDVAIDSISRHGPYALLSDTQPLKNPDGSLLKDDPIAKRIAERIIGHLLDPS